MKTIINTTSALSMIRCLAEEIYCATSEVIVPLPAKRAIFLLSPTINAINHRPYIKKLQSRMYSAAERS